MAKALSLAAGRGPASPTGVPAGARLAVIILAVCLMSLICSSLTGAGTCLEALAGALLKSHFNLFGAGEAAPDGTVAGPELGPRVAAPARAEGAQHPPRCSWVGAAALRPPFSSRKLLLDG